MVIVERDSSATTVLVTVLVLVVVGLALYFGFWRGGAPANNGGSAIPSEINVDLNTGGGAGAGDAAQ